MLIGVPLSIAEIAIKFGKTLPRFSAYQRADTFMNSAALKGEERFIADRKLGEEVAIFVQRRGWTVREFLDVQATEREAVVEQLRETIHYMWRSGLIDLDIALRNYLVATDLDGTPLRNAGRISCSRMTLAASMNSVVIGLVWRSFCRATATPANSGQRKSATFCVSCVVSPGNVKSRLPSNWCRVRIGTDCIAYFTPRIATCH